MSCRTVTALVAAALACLSLGACGGREQAGVTRAQYIVRADRICHATRVQAAPMLRRLAAGAGSLDAASVRRLAPLGRRIHTLATGYLGRMSALRQPAGDNAEIERFLSATRRAADAIGKAAAAAAAGHAVEALGALQQAQSAANDANAAAAAYGLGECARVLTLG